MSEIELRGIIPPLITPLLPSGELDGAGCRRLVAHAIKSGVHGVLVTGSNGEVAALPPRLRRQAVTTAVDEVGGRVPVIVGVARVSVEEAMEEIHVAHEAGANAALVTPPYYSPIDQNAVRSFYLRVSDRSRIPILIYNIPSFTKVSVAPEIVGELAERGAIRGIKDSSRDFDYFLHVLECVRGFDDISVFTGSDSLIAVSLAMGGQGAIGVCGNFVPEWQVAIFNSIAAGDWEAARVYQALLFTLVRAIRVGSPPSSVKAALNLLGICGDTCAAPVERLAASQRDALAATLTSLGILAVAAP